MSHKTLSDIMCRIPVSDRKDISDKTEQLLCSPCFMPYRGDKALLDFIRMRLIECIIYNKDVKTVEMDSSEVGMRAAFYRSISPWLNRPSNMAAALEEETHLSDYGRTMDLRTLKDISDAKRAMMEDIGTNPVSDRDLVIIMDRSKGMSGESNVISMAAVFTFLRLFGSDRKIKICFLGNRKYMVIDDSREGSMTAIDLLTSIPDSDHSGEEAVIELMNLMKCGSIANTDIILITHADGLKNSMSSTMEWNRWKKKTSTRVFTLVPGSSSAKAMTELSDASVCVGYDNLPSLDGRFGSFIECMNDPSSVQI